MKRPDTVPANANWNPEDNQWELGQYNSANQKISRWQAWHADGHLTGTIDYRDGHPPFRCTGYHPDGTVSQEGDWYGGHQWKGTYRWIKSENPSTEPFPAGDGHDNPNVWIVEFDYTEEEAVYNAQRYFNKERQPVSVMGEPLPPRPASVPARAHFVHSSLTHNRKSCWVAGQINGSTGKFIDDYEEWDELGNLIVKRVYHHTTFQVLEEHQYRNEQRYQSIINGPGDQTLTSYFYENITPPVVKETIRAVNENKDRTYTFFDQTGKQLYSLRIEKIGEQHTKRYYNDILSYESDLTGDKINVHYYYPDGSVMIAYVSNDNDSGRWEYHENGKVVLTIVVDDEGKFKKDAACSAFLTPYADFTPTTAETDFELSATAFKKQHAVQEKEQRLAALPVPAFLEKELKKIEWTEVDVAMYGGDKLPVYINALFAGDEAVASIAADHIWLEIEHQGSIYEATYKVATIIARCRHHYKNVPVIYSRLMNFIFSILALPGIEDYKKFYKQLVKAFSDAQPELLDSANDTNDAVALKAYYMLLHAGRESNSTATFFHQQWTNQENSFTKRSYALFTLGELYLRTKQEERLVREFSALLDTASDKFIRLILALQLVMATKKQAQDKWLIEIVNAFADPVPFEENFNALHPYMGDYDAQEYMLMVLDFAKPDVLRENIVPIIEMLPHVNSLKQATLLDAICTILFPTASAFKKISPIQKQALFAMAEVMDRDVVFVNHKEVLDAYGLPGTTLALQQLAAK
ncbi:hypothetical protein [Chitinophaga agri]|uniref:Uncharacterized protein n=1 Tax=Chitinophaga agri TaxID=2703787 RepID=A0A6B9ZA54_9BACT|nr:hypothetical protein [Chitinophaga agri]QHS59180.1 hypothetical protein GWR21_06130 [Chitinophaga agri]